MSAKQAINNKFKSDLLPSVRMIFFKSVNIWQSYMQKRNCLVIFAHLANTLLKDEGSARDNHVLASNFAKYSKLFTHTAINLS